MYSKATPTEGGSPAERNIVLAKYPTLLVKRALEGIFKNYDISGTPDDIWPVRRLRHCSRIMEACKLFDSKMPRIDMPTLPGQMIW